MNPLSAIQWLVVGGVVALLLAAGLTLHHKGYVAGQAEVQDRWDTYKAEQQLVVNKQLQALADEVLRQQDLNRKAETNYAKLQGDYAGLAQRLDRSLRQYTAARASSSSLSTTASDPAEPPHTSPGPGSPGEAAELVGLTSDVVQACYADTAQLRALLDTLN